MTGDQETNANDTTPAAAAPPPQRRRFQFSIATLLWLTTLAACLATVWAMYQKLEAGKAAAWAEVQRAKAETQAMRYEVQKYRDEMGYLDVADPEKVYALRVRSIEESLWPWCWRIYVPRTRQFRLCAAASRIPAEGFPTSGDRMISYPISHPGDNLIRAGVEQSQNGKWYLHVKAVNDFEALLETAPFSYSSDASGVFQPCAVSDPGSRLVLLRLRKSDVITRDPKGRLISTPGPQLCDGLMIWIEEVK